MEESKSKSLNFLEEIVQADLASGKYPQGIFTRFPPEPNGYLHIGHAKSICLNFGLAQKFGGKTNLRFDDTNPVTEETEYVQSIKKDIEWLGFKWAQELYTSDYFDQLYDFAVQLINKGLAYVDDSTAEEIAAGKGTPTEPGKPSVYRDRSVDENLRLFEEMKAGKYPDGAKVLRAKIDLASPNMHLRDPLMYRIKHAHHHRTGGKWCIYPMYDFAHGQSDAIEEITHSICTLEFIPHRPLYDWFIEKLELFPSHQYEFARLNINYAVMSKRKLLQLVNEKYVNGWDDPRMLTISGLRRRGYTPASIRNFCDRIGVAKRENLIEMSLLEFCIREDLNKTAWRRMAVLDPIKLVITNYPEGQEELLHGENNPEVEGGEGARAIPFSKELWIEREDFEEIPPKGYKRLYPGNKVRLKGGYVIECTGCTKDAAGVIMQVNATVIPDTKSGTPGSNSVKASAAITWVGVNDGLSAEVRLYDRLFTDAQPDAGGKDFLAALNPDSLQVVTAYVEPSLATAQPDDKFQFERHGYFVADRVDHAPGKLVFNKVTGLKDTWGK